MAGGGSSLVSRVGAAGAGRTVGEPPLVRAILTTIALGFSDRPVDDLHVDHFTGPAVKAVPVAVFAWAP